MRDFIRKEDFINRLLSVNDPSKHCLVMKNFILKILQEKYDSKQYRIEMEPYELGKEAEFIVIDNATETVYEAFTNFTKSGFVTKVTDLVENRITITNQEAIDRVWKLYEELYPLSDKPNEATKKEEIVFIPVDLIDPSPFQIRVNFDDVKVIITLFAEQGQLDPIKVKKVDDRFVLVDGEKRWKAAQELGWAEIKAIIYDEDVESSDLGISLNFGRSYPNPIAIAKAIAQKRLNVKSSNTWGKETNIIYKDKFEKLDRTNIFESCSEIDERIERRWGIDKKRQYQFINLLKEHPEIQEKISKGDLNIAEDVFTINLDKDSFGEELIEAVRHNVARERAIKRIEKRARNTNNPNAKLLCYYKFIEGSIKKIKLSNLEEADEKTKESIKNRSINLIKELMIKLDINQEELEDESQD